MLTASPGSLRFGSAGADTILHFGTELLRLTGGLQRVHAPYGHAGPGVQDCITGRIPCSWAPSHR